jgi:hypothetical protein
VRVKPQRVGRPFLVVRDSQRMASVGGVYAAKLLFEFFILTGGKPGVRRLCEERLVLVQAPSARSALRAARQDGRASEYRSANGGSPLHFRLVGVLDLLHLGAECRANEVWYDIVQRVQPMERRSAILPPESRLNAIREELALHGNRPARKPRGRRTRG